MNYSCGKFFIKALKFLNFLVFIMRPIKSKIKSQFSHSFSSRILGSRLMDPSKTSPFNTAVVTPTPGKSYSGIRKSSGISSGFDSANQDSSLDCQLISQSSSEKINSGDVTPRNTSSGIESNNTKSTLHKSLSNQNEFSELDLMSPTVTNTSE